MLGASLDRLVVTCELGSRQQIQTIVQLIPETHHRSHLRFLLCKYLYTVTSMCLSPHAPNYLKTCLFLNLQSAFQK